MLSFASAVEGNTDLPSSGVGRQHWADSVEKLETVFFQGRSKPARRRDRRMQSDCERRFFGPNSLFARKQVFQQHQHGALIHRRWKQSFRWLATSTAEICATPVTQLSMHQRPLWPRSVNCPSGRIRGTSFNWLTGRFLAVSSDDAW
jgi:hypothetical protein